MEVLSEIAVTRADRVVNQQVKVHRTSARRIKSRCLIYTVTVVNIRYKKVLSITNYQ